MMKLRFNYFIIPLLGVITVSAASYFAQAGIVWYRSLNLPEWTPSNSFMVTAWTVIFVLSCISVLIIWNRYTNQKYFFLIIGLFILNAVINVSWNIIFFYNQEIGLAFFQGVLLTFNVLVLVVFHRRCYCILELTDLAFVPVSCIDNYKIFFVFVEFH